MSPMQQFYQQLHQPTAAPDPYLGGLVDLTRSDPDRLAVVASQYEWISWTAPQR